MRKCAVFITSKRIEEILNLDILVFRSLLLGISRVDADLLVILLESSQVFARLGELTLDDKYQTIRQDSKRR